MGNVRTVRLENWLLKLCKRDRRKENVGMNKKVSVYFVRKIVTLDLSYQVMWFTEVFQAVP